MNWFLVALKYGFLCLGFIGWLLWVVVVVLIFTGAADALTCWTWCNEFGTCFTNCY